MDVLVLCKQRPMGRDLYSDPYGRFYFLSQYLARRGHRVSIHLLSYSSCNSESRLSEGVLLISRSLDFGAPCSFLHSVLLSISRKRPDLIVGFSDSLYGSLAAALGRWFGIPVLIDAYDNYESYITWLKPLHWIWRYAVKSAQVVTVAGPQLATYMCVTSGRSVAHVVPMAADPIFRPMDRFLCRSVLGLPRQGKLIGYIGSLYRNRGIEFLFEVIDAIRDHLSYPVIFVLTGRLEKGVKVPKGVEWLGYQPASRLPLLVNSMDLLLSVNESGKFGDYSYPVKIYEAMQSNVPILASDVPGSSWILRGHPECLAAPGNIDEYVYKAEELLKKGRISYAYATSWESSGAIFEELITSLHAREGHS